MPAIQGAVQDLAAIVVGHQLAATRPAKRLSPIGKTRTGSVERCHQVPWPAVDRYFEDPGWEARPIHDRFVVAGQETRALTQFGNAQRAKIVFEEDSGLLVCGST